MTVCEIITRNLVLGYEHNMTAKHLHDSTVGKCERGCHKGFLINKDTNDSELCICMSVFRYLNRLIQAGIPQEYWTLSLDKLEVPERYIQHVRKFLRNYRNALNRGLGMMFLGSNGIGKTTLMVEIGKHFALIGYSVTYFTLQRYINQKFTEYPIDISGCDVILIDEIDKAYAKPGSDYLPKTFEELVRQIISLNKVSIFSTNSSTASVKELFGGSVFSAIKRKLQIVPMKGDDYSDNLQRNWESRLKQDLDLFHETIVGMARHIEHKRVR